MKKKNTKKVKEPIKKNESNKFKPILDFIKKIYLF